MIWQLHLYIIVETQDCFAGDEVMSPGLSWRVCGCLCKHFVVIRIWSCGMSASLLVNWTFSSS